MRNRLLSLAFVGILMLGASAGRADGGQIVVTGWNRPMGDVSGYNLYMSAFSGKGYRKMNAQPISTTSYTVDGLIPGAHYYFKLTQLTQDQPPHESGPSPEFAMLASGQNGAAPPPASLLSFYEPVGGEKSMVYDPAKPLLKINEVLKHEVDKDGNSMILHLKNEDASKYMKLAKDHKGSTLIIVSGDGKELAWTADVPAKFGILEMSWPQQELMAAYLRLRLGTEKEKETNPKKNN